MRKITKWFMGIALVVLLIVDVVAYAFFDNATISVIITDMSYYSPWVPLVFGILMGHWFWPARGSKQ